MSLVQTQTDLSTADGFARRVVVARPAVSVAKGLIAVAALALAYNLFSTIKTLAEHPGLNFLQVFLSTNGDNPVSSIWFTLLVWAPIVVLPLALIFFIYARSTAQRVDHAAYLEFASSGYVATQRFTGFTALVPNGNSNTSTPVQLLSHPQVTAEAYEQTLSAIAGHVASLEKKAAKTLAKTIGKTLAKHPAATQIVPTVPAQLLLSAPIGKTEWVAVLPPNAAGGKTRYFAIKP